MTLNYVIQNVTTFRGIVFQTLYLVGSSEIGFSHNKKYVYIMHVRLQEYIINH